MLFDCIMLFLPLIFVNAFCFHALSWFIDTVCLFQVLFCMICLPLICWFFLVICTHRFFYFIYERAMCSREIVLKNSHYYYYYYVCYLYILFICTVYIYCLGHCVYVLFTYAVYMTTDILFICTVYV